VGTCLRRAPLLQIVRPQYAERLWTEQGKNPPSPKRAFGYAGERQNHTTDGTRTKACKGRERDIGIKWGIGPVPR